MSLFFEQLYWREPLWILLVLFQLLLMLWRQVQQRYSLRRYADAALLPWVIAPDVKKQNRWLLVSQFLIWLLFGLAAAGPRLLLSAPQDLLPPPGAAIIIIDHSRSMQASDVFPSRLQQAQDVLRQWSQQDNPLKLGLVIFSGASHIVLPATSDKQALQDSVILLNEIQLPTHGSAIVQSLQQAKSLLLEQTGSRAIIMLTDGDVSQEKYKQLKQLGEQLSQQNITLHLLGVGTPSPMALTDDSGHWLQYDGETVITRLNEVGLQSLAKNNGVFYSRLNPDVHNEIHNVWQAAPARIAVQHFDEVLWKELFPWFLIPALLLIIVNSLSLPRVLSPALAVAVIAWSMQPLPVQANETNILQQAYTNWQNKNYSAAAKAYASVDGYYARMGEGASCFREHQLQCAITAFSRAAWEADTDEQRGRAAFNLGNSFFRQGDFKSAITLYQDALRYSPQQAAYKNNLDFSEQVQQNIERRRQQEIESQKAAQRRRGENAVDIAIDIDNQRVSEMIMMLGDELKNKAPENARRFTINEQQLAEYMQRSQNFARLSSKQNKRRQRQHDWSRFSNENPMAARRVEYWQRLFELEEGIPAHPDTAKILPGEKPW